MRVSSTFPFIWCSTVKPARFGRYLLIDRISRGGMAEVYLGREPPADDRIVAIKRILPVAAEDLEFRQMFIDEATISAQLAHQNIGELYEFGEVEGRYFLAMEYVPGRDVRQIRVRLAERKEHMPVPMALHICAMLCRALEHAHGQCDAEGRSLQIVHRDVSPPNVLVSYQGEVKLIDFGIARAASRLSQTRAGKLKGKFAYMSPEQVEGRAVDHRSDVFSAGTLLFEMLTHRRPFRGESEIEVMKAIRRSDPPPPSTLNADVPIAVDRIVANALAKQPSARYGSAAALGEALTAFMARTSTHFGPGELAAWMGEAFSNELVAERLRRDALLALDPAECLASLELAELPTHSASERPSGPPLPVLSGELHPGARAAGGEASVGTPRTAAQQDDHTDTETMASVVSAPAVAEPVVDTLTLAAGTDSGLEGRPSESGASDPGERTETKASLFADSDPAASQVRDTGTGAGVEAPGEASAATAGDKGANEPDAPEAPDTAEDNRLAAARGPLAELEAKPQTGPLPAAEHPPALFASDPAALGELLPERTAISAPPQHLAQGQLREPYESDAPAADSDVDLATVPDAETRVMSHPPAAMPQPFPARMPPGPERVIRSTGPVRQPSTPLRLAMIAALEREVSTPARALDITGPQSARGSFSSLAPAAGENELPPRSHAAPRWPERWRERIADMTSLQVIFAAGLLTLLIAALLAVAVVTFGRAPAERPAVPERVGSLVLTTNASGSCTLRIDREAPREIAPAGSLALANLSPGTHRVELHCPGSPPLAKTVVIRAGEVAALDLPLRAP